MRSNEVTLTVFPYRIEMRVKRLEVRLPSILLLLLLIPPPSSSVVKVRQQDNVGKKTVYKQEAQSREETLPSPQSWTSQRKTTVYSQIVKQKPHRTWHGMTSEQTWVVVEFLGKNFVCLDSLRHQSSMKEQMDFKGKREMTHILFYKCLPCYPLCTTSLSLWLR